MISEWWALSYSNTSEDVLKAGEVEETGRFVGASGIQPTFSGLKWAPPTLEIGKWEYGHWN